MQRIGRIGCVPMLAAVLAACASRAQTVVRGAAQLAVDPAGSLALTIDGKPFLHNPYTMLTQGGQDTSLWSMGTAAPEVTVADKGEGPVTARIRREVAGVVTQETRAIFGDGMLAVHWRLRFGELAASQAGGYREVGFFIPWASLDGMGMQAETAFSADLTEGVFQASMGDRNPAPGGCRWMRLRHGARSIRLEPFGMQVQSRPEGCRVVAGGRIEAGSEVVLAVLLDWSGRLDGSAYDAASGAKRPRFANLGQDGFAVDVCADRRLFHHPGERAAMVLRTVSPNPPSPRVAARYRIEDYWDRVVSRGEVVLSAVPGAATVQVLEVPTATTGMFRFVLSYAGDQGEVRQAQALYGVVPARRRAPPGWDSPFGMHLPATAHHAALGRQIGVDWIRTHDTAPYAQWRWAEPEEGRWTWHDAEYDRMRDAGMQILGVLNRPPDWAMTRAEQRHLLEWTEDDLGMWRRYCERVMTHYHRRIGHWEVLNEPYGAILAERDAAVRERRAAGYVRLLRIAHEVARSLDPAPRIVGVCGPPGYYAMDWYPLTFAAGALEHMDILSAHLYPTFFRWPPSGGEDWDREQGPQAWYRQIRDHLRAHGKESMEVWNTEAGSHHVQTFYTDFEPNYRYGTRGPAPKERVQTWREAAMYTVRQAVIDSANAAKRFHYTGVGGAWYFHSIAEGDQTPMPAMVAWAVMTDVLAGARYAGAADLGPLAQVHVWEIPGGAAAVVWGTGRAPQDWQDAPVWFALSPTIVSTAADQAELAAGAPLPAQVGLLTARDVMGAALALRRQDRTGFLLSEQPVWLEAYGMSASSLLEEFPAVRLALPRQE